MKRAQSSSPPSSPVEPINPPSAKKAKTSSALKIPPSSPTKSRAKAHELDPKIRGQLLDEAIMAGYKTMNLNACATKYGMSKKQLSHQFEPNRSNIRSKAVKAVSTS